ncbi:uroporphyrinogen-III synthase [Pseudogemmobacter sp. W21_MBD1_M6]|uniref:uroporphyrinogen-III synthase n=1 Tax=Pseudogemmobacter sp. W21_MBD1_M6 TaxID=3240271 RepID=UPI003F998E5D
MHQRPLLIMTRPRKQAERFVQECLDQTGPVFDVLVSPLIEIEMLNPNAAIWAAETLIFTSENGVQSVLGQADVTGRTAFCVGDRTASAARDAGMNAMSAGGSVKDLAALIAEHAPRQPMVHICGEHTRGNIAQTLVELGFDVRSVVAYRQVEVMLTSEARNAIQGERVVVLPLFSPRTARLFFEQVGIARAPTHVVAMSSAVAFEVDLNAVLRCVVAELPTSGAMIKAIAGVMRDLRSLEGS